MANFQAPVIATQLPLDGAAGRLRGSLATTTGERGRLFEIRTRKYQIVPRFEGRNEVRKLYSPLHLRVVFPPPRGRGAKILAVPGQMKEFRSLETSEGGCLLKGEGIRHNAAFEAAAGGLCRVSCFPPQRADARLHKVASSGQNGRTKPMVGRWLVLRNWLGNMEVGQEIKTDSYLTTWTDLTNEADFRRIRKSRDPCQFLASGAKFAVAQGGTKRAQEIEAEPSQRR
jgi:hypothetical protein